MYEDVLELFAGPQLRDTPKIIFQPDDASPHWSLDGRDFLDNNFLNIGLDDVDQYNCQFVLQIWPPRLFHVGFHKVQDLPN